MTKRQRCFIQLAQFFFRILSYLTLQMDNFIKNVNSSFSYDWDALAALGPHPEW